VADTFFLVGLPYVALGVMLAGTLYRFRKRQYGVSALSSQMLEDRALVFGTLPWHVGIFVILIGHLVPLLMPGIWHALVSNRVFLLTVETIGLAAAVLAAIGLTVLIVRRALAARLQSVTTLMDQVVLVLLLAQVVLGMLVATGFRWGSSWASGTLWPYVWSILTLRPEPGLVAEMPAIIKAHVIGAWLIVACIPFSRLVHAFSVPIEYLARAPQQVIWATERRLERLREEAGGEDPLAGRRHALRGVAAMLGTGLLLSMGVLDKFARFFRGDEMSPAEKEHLMSKKLARVRQTETERSLEVERMKSELIPVGRLTELKPKNGKYFIDYQMRPALAFVRDDGLPLLISAKCTHLGCTVASEMDEQGRILCPCHISYFDVKTGKPNEGAPAKAPLPHLGWVIREGETIVASQLPGGAIEGKLDPAKLESYEVCIARKHAEEKA
jgi:nitrate reductase gamma subunit